MWVWPLDKLKHSKTKNLQQYLDEKPLFFKDTSKQRLLFKEKLDWVRWMRNPRKISKNETDI